MAANETLTVAFAYLAADDLNQLTAAAQAAKDVYVVPGPPNTASMLFDGVGDRVRVLDATPVHPEADSTAYQITGSAITLEAWVYLMGLPGPNSGMFIAARPGNNGVGVDPWQSYALVVNNYDGTGVPKLSFMVAGGTAGSGVYALDNVAVQTGQWYHVAGTYDGADVRLYVNGMLKSLTPASVAIASGSVGFYVGGFTYDYFRGLIDEVRLWNVARSEAQILNWKDVTLQGAETGLAGYWPFDSTYVSGPNTVTPDLTGNHNDLVVQFDAKVVGFPKGSTVQFVPTNISGGRDAATGFEYRGTMISDGWPKATLTLLYGPGGMVQTGDTLVWTPTIAQYGPYEVIAQATNGAGALTDTFIVYSEAIRSSENLTRVDITNRGKIGLRGMYGRGVFYGGKNGLYGGDFSLVDRNSTKYAGGLYSALNSFRPLEGFTDVPSRFPGFTAFRTSFNDEWEPTNRIGVKVIQTAHVKSTAPDDHYTIIEYRVVNESGSPIDDLFAQMTADFDLGNPPTDRGGYDTSLALTYAYQESGVINSNIYGFQLLNRPASGHAVFVNGTDAQFVRSTTNLTAFPALPVNASDTRNQISTGPFTIAVNETLTVAFAYLAGDSVSQLVAAAQAARVLYQDNTTSVNEEVSRPLTFALGQNFPNPFNPSTSVRFSLPTASDVRLEVFNVLGQSVAVLVDGQLEAGHHQASWRSMGSSGVYVYRMEARPLSGSGGPFVSIRRMVLLK